MKKLILKMSVSVDGFVAGPKEESDWIFSTASRDSDQWELATIWNASLHLMGSRTYQDMAAWWPTAKGQFAAPMNQIPKAVFSRRGVRGPDKKLTTRGLKHALAANPNQQGAKPSEKVLESWLHPRIFTGNLATEIKRLKRGSGKPLLAHGGAGFARSLIGTGLIDEYHLLVHPVALGRGLAIFSDLRRQLSLSLIKSIGFKGGSVAHLYRATQKSK